MSVKAQAIVAGLLMGILLGQYGVLYVKLTRANQKILELKARNSAIEKAKELYRSFIWEKEQKETYGYWYEYVDMKERVDSLTQVVKKLENTTK